jgi:polyisoprenoid-binding protein YceI
VTITAEPPPQHKKRSRSPLTWVIVAMVVIVVLAVGGPFVYIHFFNGDAPAPLTLSSSPTSSASASASSSTVAGATGGAASSSAASLDGTWKVASGSQAGYRVSEVLLGQSTEAVGRTSSVTGDATIAGGKLTAVSMSVDMTSVTSDKSQRDQQFQTRIMNTATYPTATFALTKPIDLSGLPTDGSTGTATATGDLTLHGTTKSVDIPLQVKQDGADIDVNGSLKITFADYGVDNPSAGPAQVGDDGTLEFLVKLSKS